MHRTVFDRKSDWLRDRYAITPDELADQPRNIREEVEHAWVMFWRDECEAGRGVIVDNVGRGSHRAA